MREAINQLRRDRYLIGSCRGGYYIPANRDEALIARAYITQLFAPLKAAVDGYDAALELEYGMQESFDLEAIT